MLGFVIKNKTFKNTIIKQEREFTKYIVIAIIESLLCFIAVGEIKLVVNVSLDITIKITIVLGIAFMFFWINIQRVVQRRLYHSRNYYREELRKKEKNMEIRENYYQAQQENYMEMMYFRHDTKRNLRYICELNKRGKREEIDKYIRQMDVEIDQGNHLVECGNVIISTVMTDIAMKAKKNNVTFFCEGHISKKIKLNEMEIGVVLGNILENALEACLECKRESFINVRLFQSDENIIILIKNSTSIVFMEKNQKLFSNKLNGRHGIGMKNVVRILHKYGGDISWEVKNNEFITEIIL